MNKVNKINAFFQDTEQAATGAYQRKHRLMA